MANLRTNNLAGEQGQNAYRGSVQFLGENDALVIPASSDFAYGTGDFTIEAWIWKAGTPATGETRGIFTQTQSGNDYIVFKIGSTNIIQATFGGTTISTTEKLAVHSWNHVAVSRSSNTVKVFLNGIASSGSTVSTDFSDTTRNPTIGNYTHSYGSLDYNGFISNFRVTKGEALYTADFTPPTTELTADANTVLLCCQNSNDPTQEETGKTITASGNLATAGYLETQPKVIPPYGVDAGNAFGGSIQQSSQGYMYFPTGRTEERGRGRGLFGGGVTPSGTTRISLIDIQSQGNSIRFGALTRASTLLATCSSKIRGLWGGDYPSAGNTIDFVTIATTGDAQDFGDLTDARYNFSGCGNDTRGLFGGGHDPAYIDVIDFVTIASTGNATDFGNLLAGANGVTSAASPTRGLWFGGDTGSKQNVIQFVTIATTGNAQDFGDMQEVKHNTGSLSSQTRALVAGGNTGSMVDTIDFVEIATTGNGSDFGNLTQGRQGLGTVSNSLRGVFAAGLTPSNTNTMDFVTIATTGDAQDFGDLDPDQTHMPEGCSDSHGGLS